MRLYDVPAPAKLNLFLHVTGRRDDGYHLLQTVFRFVDLNDNLSFERRNDGLLQCDNSLPGLQAEDDLILRAAKALQQATGTQYGAQISCVKRIPAGGGLGGGSSNAATTLIALNRLWETGLNRSQLMKLALPLGADVPVFVLGQSAFAEGIGEQLTPVSLPERGYLIVQPDQHVSTPDIFNAPDLTRDTKSIRITVFTDWLLKQQGLFGRNDLQAVVCFKYGKVEKALAFLAEQGIKARMTGSGACLFAEFNTYAEALLKQRKIIGKIPNCGNAGPVINVSWACHGLIDHPLRYWTKD